ncbi:transposase [Pontibacterium granulatum]|uniref:REP-associated tyrosine transposase n=1 Tax=Pontibacterium granulatum TaxID=2036029 RepID=UPI00249C25A5|nr:transposase [Pontibacterium granulatum]MDI3323454.1 transposase [Pontibacterium granulatum]
MATSKFRTQNLRIGRHSAPHQIYMITTVAHRRSPLFEDLFLGRCVVNALRQAESSAHTLAYVVMPNHLHWLMQLREEASLATTVQFMKTLSARSVNEYNGSKGKVWAKGYYDQALRDEGQVRDFARYIVANPLRSGLVRSVKDYPLWDAVWL